jgi:hypothetical protein
MTLADWRTPIAAAFVFALAGVLPALGRTLGETKSVCPFSGLPFLAITENSGSQMCMRLDLKPVGFIGAPPRVPICPDHRFPVYRTDWSKADIARLRPWVESDEFRILAANESPYFRIARIEERLAAPQQTVAWSYLAASWQVEDDPERYRRYLELALARLGTHLATATSDSTQSGRALSNLQANLVAAEIERRLGRFDAALDRLVPLDAAGNDTLAPILQRERELNEHRDGEPHYLSQGPESDCAALDRRGTATDRAEWAPGEALPFESPGPTKGPLPPAQLRR